MDQDSSNSFRTSHAKEATPHARSLGTIGQTINHQKLYLKEESASKERNMQENLRTQVLSIFPVPVGHHPQILNWQYSGKKKNEKQKFLRRKLT